MKSKIRLINNYSEANEKWSLFKISHYDEQGDEIYTAQIKEDIVCREAFRIYERKGLLLEETILQDGSTTIRRYENNLIVEESNPLEYLHIEYVYKYTDGRLDKKIELKDGSLNREHLYFYNENEQLVKKVSQYVVELSEESELSAEWLFRNRNVWLYKYQDELLIEELMYSGSMLRRRKTITEEGSYIIEDIEGYMDEHGAYGVMHCSEYVDNRLQRSWKVDEQENECFSCSYTYENDSFGNWVVQIKHEEGRINTVGRRSIVYY